MILRRILIGAAAAGAALGAAGSLVVACVYALFSWLQPLLGSAGAAGGVALVLAAMTGVGVWLATSKASGKAKPKVRAEAQPTAAFDRALALARERPIAAAATTVAAGLVALRNPSLVAAISRAVVERQRATPR